MNDRIKFCILLGLFIASLGLLWFANVAANQVVLFH